MEFHPYLKVMLPNYPYLIHTAVSEIMVAIGKIMAHSIVQLGIGPGFFPTAAYIYICSGDFSTVIPFINVDAATPRIKYFLDKVSWL